MDALQKIALVGLAALALGLVGCNLPPQQQAAPAEAFKVFERRAWSSPKDGYLVVRILVKDGTPATVQQALQQAHDAAWGKEVEGTDGRPVTSFQGYAHLQQGQPPIGILEHGNGRAPDWIRLPTP